MISDKERRKAASILRLLGYSGLQEQDMYETLDKAGRDKQAVAIALLGAVCFSLDDAPSLRQVILHLADLIEPRHETTEDVSGDYGKFECGKCGCRIDDVTAVDNGGINFCPDCGREVVS